MKGSFSVVNKRGLLVASILLVISMVLFSLSLAQMLGGGSRLWLIPIIIFIAMFFICILILFSVLTAGVDVKEGKVIFASADGEGGKKVQFSLSMLKDVQLHNADGPIQNPAEDSLLGGRVVFFLKDGSTKTYYPVSITYRQYENIRNGLLEMKSYL